VPSVPSNWVQDERIKCVRGNLKLIKQTDLPAAEMASLPGAWIQSWLCLDLEMTHEVGLGTLTYLDSLGRTSLFSCDAGHYTYLLTRSSM
jgi:hypothetical protein